MTERLLAAATRHVAEHGWSKAALFAAADDLGYSRAVVGSVRNGAGALVHHFCEDCDSRLSVRIVMEQEDALDPLLPSERLATAIKWRLEMLEPVIESWPAAPPRRRRRRTPPRRRRASRSSRTSSSVSWAHRASG